MNVKRIHQFDNQLEANDIENHDSTKFQGNKSAHTKMRET